ncbi:MAG: helix-turn-helix domain-containing protein [Chitinophagaceae bacterium]
MITKQDISTRIGSRIRSFRNKRQWSIEELASQSGLDYSQLSRIERGKINTSVYHLYVISKALKLELGQIFDGIFNDIEDPKEF